MKKSVTSIVLGCIFFTAMEKSFAQGKYQLINGGFENDWYRETSNAGSIVPEGFNSFYSGSGGMIGTASAKRQDSTRDVRPGATGIFSLVVYNNAVLGVRANGNVTTGRINAASITASNESNHNYTDTAYNAASTPINPIKYCQKITGTPDSLRFWVKYLPSRTSADNRTDKGRIRVLIHGTGECRDAANYPSGKTETDYYYGKAVSEFYKENGGWHQYTVPFVYDGKNKQKTADSNYYVLVSLTSNSSPGGGANGSHAPGASSYPLSVNVDYAFYDDIELVYSAWLNDLKVLGTTITGFEKGLRTYGGPKPGGSIGNFTFPYQPSDFSWTPEVNDIVSVVVTNVNGPGGDADGGYTSVLITAEDSVTQVEYKMYYFANLSNNNNINTLAYTIDGIDTIHVPGFNSAQLNYNITLTDPEEARIPKIVDTSIVLSHPMADIYRITQPTGINSVGSVVVRAEDYNMKIYTITFTKVLSKDSTLSMIRMGGNNLVNFHPDTLVYDTIFTTCLTTIPTIAATASSVYASVSVTQATQTNRTATIVVTAENGAKRTYTINFALQNNNANLRGYRVGSTNRDNTFNDTTFLNIYSASYTAAPALSLSTTAGQQVCAASSVVFPTPVLWFPDTNFIKVTAQDNTTKQTYGVIIKNTNCYLKQTTGSNIGLKYMYNGVVRNITIPSASNNNDVTVNVTIPVSGPNEPCVLIDADPQAPKVDTIIYTQPTARTGNSGRVRVIANDGVAGKNYIINFTANISNDATLNSMTYNGFPVPGFSPENESYTLIFPSNAAVVPEIEVTPSFQWLVDSNIVIIPAATLLDTTFVEVTAENGTTKKTYMIDFELVEQEKDAYLTDIRYDNVTIPGFNPTMLNYTIDIPYSAPMPPAISVYPSSPTALVFYAQQMKVAPYTQQILVYSEDMMVINIYTVSFNLVKNIDATLSDIKVNGILLQDFNPQEFVYDHELPYTEFNAPVVTANPTYPYAQVNIAQINTVAGTVTIDVTAEDNTYTATYTVDFTRELSPIADMDTIKYNYNSQNYAHKAINSGTGIITIVLPVETDGIPNITDVTLADNRSGFVIDEQPTLLNNLTGTITVTAEDLTEEIYEVYFQRTLSPSTLLTEITYNNISIPNFHPDTSIYTIILPFGSTAPTVVATADWKNTIVTVNQTGNPNGGIASISVSSEDGLHSKNYQVRFILQGDVNLVSLLYNIEGTDNPIPGFNPSVFNYNIVLPMATTDIPVLKYVCLDSRAQVTQNVLNGPNGTIQLVIITTDGIPDTLIYTVNFIVTLSTEALLLDLQVDGVTIDNFYPLTVLNYSMEVDYYYGVSTLPNVTATATQPDARIEVTQITSYPGTAIIKVYAGDTTISRTYTIAFSMEPADNTYLSELSIDEELLWNFNKNIFFYEIKLPYGTTQVPEIDAIAEDLRSNVTIIQASQIGDTAIIYVLALSGDDAYYKVHFTVRKNPNALAKMIYIDWDSLENFDPVRRNYTYILPANQSGMPFVTVELQNPNATYNIIPPTTIPAQMQIIVTAEDTDSTFSYRIMFEKTTTSVISYDNQAEIKVYPNPTNGKLRVIGYELQENTTIEIFDIVGKKLSTLNSQLSTNEIDISHLSVGMYFLKVDNNKLIKVIKD